MNCSEFVFFFLSTLLRMQLSCFINFTGIINSQNQPGVHPCRGRSIDTYNVSMKVAGSGHAVDCNV